jgi:hypothetical protein
VIAGLDEKGGLEVKTKTSLLRMKKKTKKKTPHGVVVSESPV